jgi:RNA polymerase sigma-70 factor (ECF subfamily)
LSEALAASDEVLIGRIAGDRLAMQVLYGRHHVRCSFGLRLVRDERCGRPISEFSDVWRQAASSKADPPFPPGSWRLRFKALSALRRRKDAELDDEAANAIEDTSDDPEVVVQKKDTSQALRKCPTSLSPEHGKSSTSSTTTEVRGSGRIVGIPGTP